VTRISNNYALYLVQLEVQAASVADRVPLVVAPPQGGGRGVAVGALEPGAPVATLKPETEFLDRKTKKCLPVLRANPGPFC
jgi:hypothetical protein